MNDSRTAPAGGDRLAKVMARSGLCSRRDAEEWIKAGRVVVNGRKVLTPAFNVTDADEVLVDGTPLAARAGTRVWLYHKPRGLVVTEKDPEGRPTIFETLATQGLPRVLSIGRLDINTEGLLLLTNDGGLKRVLELPATGWLRKYRVRAHGTVTQAQLDGLKHGIEIDGVKYGPIEATLERDQGANVWIEVALREGKNREVKNVLGALGLEVNRLIRISFGPFQLGELPVGGVETVKARVLKDQLGKRLADEAEVDFDSEMPERAAASHRAGPAGPAAEERTFGRGTHTVAIAQQRFRFTDRAELTPAEAEEQRRQKPRPGRPGTRDTGARGPARSTGRDDAAPARHIHFDDGREPALFEEKTYGRKGKPQADADRPRARARARVSRHATGSRSIRIPRLHPPLCGAHWGGGFLSPDRRSLWLSLVLFVIAFGADRLHKYIQIAVLGWRGGEYVPVTGFFDYVLVWNTGISYGLFATLPVIVLGVLMIIAIIALAVWWSRAGTMLLRAGLALCIGGALSNALDRWIYGGVADFFHFHYEQYSFYIFNLADAAITIGVIVLLLDFVGVGRVKSA